MEMNQNNKEQRHSHGGGGGVGGGSLSCSSDLNHSSSSNSNSISLTQSQSQSQSHKHNDDPMHSWWESVSKARSRIRSLVSLLPPSSSSEEEEEVCSLADSDRPGRALLGSHSAYLAISSSLSGGGDDPLCHWLYDTFQDDDPDLRLFVVSIIPLVAGLYLSRVHCCSTTSPSPGSPSLAGFEAVLLALYSSQAKSRSGKPLVVSIPTPSHLAHHPSLYHHPSSSSSSSSPVSAAAVGVVCPPLEPQVGIKSTKRATILGVAFHCFYSHISLMPSWSKLDLCRFAASWAGPAPAPAPDTPLLLLTNDNSKANANDDDVQIPLPWELLQPMLRILGHCLLAPPPLVSDLITQSASIAVSRLYARASHDLSPQAILATRSLLHLHSRPSPSPSPSASAPATPTSISNPPDLLLLSA